MLCYFIVFGNKRAIREGDEKKKRDVGFPRCEMGIPPPPAPYKTLQIKYDTA